MKTIKRCSKFLAVLLTVLTIVSILPMQTFAEEYHSWQPEQETVTDTGADAVTTAEILYEVTSKREANKKVFKKNDGTYTAMVSPVPMHYEQDGKWIEIDNSLTVKNKKLQNINSKFNVSFPEYLYNAPVSVLSDTYKLTFSLDNVSDSKAKVKEKKARNKTDETPADEVLDKLSSTVTYKNIFKHTDLEYTLSGNSVKENIIIKKASAAQESYSFHITADGLTGVMGTNGEIVFGNAENNEIFKIPAPVMIDAESAVSKDIAVSFTENEAGGYTLCYTPSAEWLQAQDRKYPVKLDPVVKEVESTYTYRAMVSENFPDEKFYDVYSELEITPENYWEFGNIETYFCPIPKSFQIPHKDVYNVTLCMHGQVNGILGAYYVKEMWNPQSITYATRPKTEPEPFDYYCSESNFYDEGSWINFDLTELARNSKWFVGIMLRLATEYVDDEPDDWYAIFNRLPNDDQNEIFLYYEYRDPEAFSIPLTEENYSASAGRAGTAAVNEGSGRLSVTRDDIAISGNIMPAQISFGYNTIKAWRSDFQYYNAAKAQLISGQALSKPYGRKWLSAYNKFFYMTDEGENDVQYVYYDGNCAVPLSVSRENGKWEVCEAYTNIFGEYGYEFIVDVPDGDTRAFYEIYDCITVRGKDGCLQSYDANGRLVKIYREKYPNQSIDIAYISNLSADENFFAIDYVTDGVGRKYDFTYTDGLLSSIQCYAADGTGITAGSTTKPLKMAYEYTEGELTTVTFPDEKTVSYGTGMSYMKNIDGYSLVFSGSDDCSGGYSETAGGNTAGGSLCMSRSGNEVVISQNGKSVTKRFDNYGRTLMTIDDDGNYGYYDYTNSTDGTPTVSAVRAAGGNLLHNGGFENGLQDWTAEGLTAADISSAFYNTGTYALKCIGAVNTEKSVSQTVTELTAGIYTLSAYVKVSADAQPEDTLYLTLTALSENGDVLKEESSEIAAPNTDFIQYTRTTEAPSGTRAIKVCVHTDSSTGTFCIDDVQLEKSSYASDANCMANGDFRDGLNAWFAPFHIDITDKTFHEQTVKAACMQTKLSDSSTLLNTVPINGKKDEVVVVSAWVDTSNVILDAPDYIYDLSREIDPHEAYFIVAYNYKDENGNSQTQIERIDLQERIPGWTCLRQSLTLKGDCKNISVLFGLAGSFSKLYITNVEVMKAKNNNALAEDEILEELPETENTHYCVCGEDCAYGADCPCTCTSAESCTCEQCKGCPCADCTEFQCECRCESEAVCDCPQCKKKFDITYDEFGNLLSLKLMGKDLGTWLAMMTSRSYDTRGNYMTSSTDENGNLIRYRYNQNNGMLNAKTDARGNLTEYTYDAIGALTQIKTPVSELTNLLSDDMITSYEYTNDRVSTIKHNDFAYNITYDAWGNVKSIFVGALDTALTIPYVEYTYGAGDYRSRIEKVSFKNGNTISYRYDGDLLTGISYNDGESYPYEYAYDELGYLAKIQDNAQNRVIYYNTDSVEVYENNALRYKAYTDSDGNFAEIIDGTLYVTKQYDTQISEETNMRSARTGLSVDGKELSVSTVTDKFGRKTAQSVSACQPENTNAPFAAVTANYTYKQYQKNGESMAGSRIDTITNTVKATGKADSTPYTFAYEYDENNNITREYAVNSSGKKTLRYRYTYDEANQLVRADDNVAGKTYVYAYNKGGNRIFVKTYAYTLGTELGEAQKTNLALYGDLIWRDRMTSFNEDVVVYDSIGNPISYNGNTYTWEGRQLKSISNNSGKTEFFYDADGLRTETRVYNANNSLVQTDKYIWQDGKMISHTLVTSKKSETVRILYDSDSQPRGYITDSGETVLFVKNLQGDVIALVDGNGKVAVEYSYDAWGNMTYTRKNGTSYSAAERLVELCPITYRGYNYDFSTGLYYLQSRYYNPKWGRFLNCDDTNILLATQGETHGANLFAYADNNPVNRVDYTGKWSSDVHLGAFSKDVSGKKGYYQTAYVYGFYVPYKRVNRKKHYYGTYYWARSVGFGKDDAFSIASNDNSVDDNFSWLFHQNLHFNTNPVGMVDSRIVAMTFMLLIAFSSFNEALQLKNNGAPYKSYMNIGLECLGRALHSAQDYYAHTNDRVYDIPYQIADEYYTYTSTPPFVIYHPAQYIIIKAHSPSDNTDNAVIRWDQLLETEELTLGILREFYNSYRPLFT